MSTEEKKVDADKKDGEKCPADEAGWSVRGAVGKAAGNFVVTQAVRHYGKVVVLLPNSMIFYYTYTSFASTTYWSGPDGQVHVGG